MILSKCRPIIVKPLTVMASQKHPSPLTSFLSAEHSIHTRDINQDIGDGIMTNTNKMFDRWEGKQDGVDPPWQPCPIPFYKGASLNYDFSLPCPMLVPFCPLSSSSITLYFHTCTVLTYRYKPRVFISFLTLISPECLVPFLHSQVIKLLIFTPMYTALLLIPPKQ